MKDEELEKTKPIEVLSEFSRASKHENTTLETREEKYSDAVVNEEKAEAELEEQKELQEMQENAEEALAEKNIAEAEAILEREKNEKEIVTPDIIVKDKKDNVFTKIKDKWSKLDKKKKILIIVITILVLILIGILVTSLILKNNKVEEEKPKEEEKVEEAPVIIDNYYYRDGKLFFTSDGEEVIGNYECENKDSNLCYVGYNNSRDNFDVPKLQDETGKEIVQRFDIYEDRYVFIIDNKDESDKTIKLFSMTDNKLVGTYNSVKAYDNNYFIVEDTSKNFGLLQINDGVNEIIAPEYAYLGMMDGENNLIAKNKKGYVVVDKTNKILSTAIDASATVKSYNDTMVVVMSNNEYSVYDYKANLIAGGYAFASVKGNYMALVDSNKHLSIKDVEKIKYNEASISLDTNNYVKTYIYDSNGNIKKIKRSYELNIKNDSIEVAIYDASDDVVYENVALVYGIANRKYNYYNYFDGKLYFYRDETKEDLIGSYTCSNKNYIESSSDMYTSCYPAKDTIFEDNDMMTYADVNRKATAPLINNTYVFINDGTNNIKLYDLLQNKAIGTYSSINTYTPNNDYEFTSYQGTKEVVGVNKKGEYGVLSFDNNGVTARLSFEYKNIEKVGTYYSVSEDGNKWYLLDHGSKSASYKGRVMGYSNDLEYIKVINGKKYSVLNKDGTEVTDSTYTFVDLYSNFYVGVDSSNNIYIYDYDGNKLSNDTVKAPSYPFSKTDNKAIKVTKNGNQYTVLTYNGTSYDEHVFNPIDNEEEEEDS